MNAPRIPGDVVPLGGHVPERATTSHACEPGKFSGELSAKLTGTRAALMAQFRDQAPARWRAFLHAHFSSPQEASLFFGVDEKTGRNWWNGVGRPMIDKVLLAQVEFPDSYQHYMIAAE